MKQNHIWHPFTPLSESTTLPVVVKAKGTYLYTETGRKIIDGISSWWVNVHGHAHPRLARAIYKQAQVLEQVIFANFTHPPALRLTEKLLNLLPHPYARVFFSDNGSTAVEVAVKMALQYFYNTHQSNYHNILALEGAYHGDTFGAMSVGGRSIFNAPFQKHLFSVTHIPFPSKEQESEALEVLRTELAKGKYAAFICEPLLQAAAGMRYYSADWLQQAFVMCKRAGVLCIADEVFTGFYRTGKRFATSVLRESPDIIVVSKALTGGFLPLGLTICNKKVAQAFEEQSFEKTFFHGHSYTANPLACAVALESIQILEEEKTQLSLQRLAQRQLRFFHSIQTHPKVEYAYSLGPLGALVVKTESETGYMNQLRQRILDFFMERDILLRPLGNVLYVLPPYSISGVALRSIHRAIREFLNTL